MFSGGVLQGRRAMGSTPLLSQQESEAIAVLNEYHNSLEEKVDVNLHGRAAGDAGKKQKPDILRVFRQI
jgi:hypothetical protein